MTINQKTNGDCGYIGFYNSRQIELYATSLYSAKVLAVKHFNPPKSKAHMVSVHLAELTDSSQAITTLN